MRIRVSPACSIVLAFAASASAQVPAGPEFRVNTYTTGSQYVARPAMEPDGDFVIVWASEQDGDSSGVFGRRFAPSGAPRGGEFQINGYTTGAQSLPVVAVGRRGDFVVAWVSVEDGSGTSIQGRRFDTGGNPIGADFAVNSDTTGNQIWPHVDRASDGRFVVSWRTMATGIGIRRFDASGSPIGAQMTLGNVPTGFQGFDDLAVAADGSFVVVREEVRNISNTEIIGTRFDAAGSPVGGVFLVNSYTTGYQIRPSINASPAGGFAVAWSSQFGDGSDYGVLSRRFDAAGSPLGSDFVVNTFTTGRQTGLSEQVAHDARGNFVVTWEGPDGSSNGVFAQRFAASGARRGAEFRVNTYTTGQQWNTPSVASDEVGNFVVVWESGHDGSGRGNFAQRFGGLFPAALALDPAPGNQVLEPGETVAVRPSWRNFNGVAQTFTGGLSGIIGPSGATYAVTDGVATYGTVANGAIGQCTDCYGVSVSNPPSRPELHWDASAVEGILPDSQGQQKQWLLHVGSSFTDVAPSSAFYRFVETLLHRGVTGGCTATTYCRFAATTREQMAVFVLVAKEGAGYGPPSCGATPMFADVPVTSPFCRWIEELARRNVVGGCGAGNYCPAAGVSREQMAVFVLRTLDPSLVPPACTAPVFADVPASSAFCRWIEELARRGIVTGCGGGNYCPAAAVTREQMGVFIGVTFGLTLYGP